MENLKCCVSVIVPVYNVSVYLDKCIESIVNQTYKNIEIILIDDHSTDTSLEICKNWKKLDSRITVIENQDNIGLGLTRNIGLQYVKGNYVIFVDSDDYIEPDHIQNLHDSIIHHNADVVYAGFKKLSKEKISDCPNILSGQTFEKEEVVKNTIPLMCGRLKLKGIDSIQMSVCMSIYSFKIISRYGIRFYSEREFISEDFLFNIDYLEHSDRVSFENYTGYVYRYNDKSLTNSYNPNRLKSQIKMTKEIINRTKKLKIYELCEQRILATFYSWIWFLIKESQKNAIEFGRDKSVDEIRKICSNEFVHLNIYNYDLRPLPLQTKLTRIMIKYKMANSLWIAAKIKSI